MLTRHWATPSISILVLDLLINKAKKLFTRYE